MILPPLAKPSDVAVYGYIVDDADLARASVRVRAHTNQAITAGTYSATSRGPRFRLPQRPVRRVVSVTESRTGRQVGYELCATGIVEVDTYRVVTVAYEAGFDPPPDELVELVGSIADRLHQIPAGLIQGKTSEQAGSESHGLGASSHRGATSLTDEEKAKLDKLFPQYPNTWVMVT